MKTAIPEEIMIAAALANIESFSFDQTAQWLGASMVYFLASPHDKMMFSDWCHRSPWWKQFTQCVTAAGEAKSRAWKHLRGFLRWHDEAVKRVEIAESALNLSKKQSA